MPIEYNERGFDSPLIESIWTCNSRESNPGTIHSIAASHWGMIFTRQQGQTSLTLHGPETVTQTAECPADADWLGIYFKLGVRLAGFEAADLVDAEIELPNALAQSFWLNGSAWQFPTAENAEVFVARLAREGLLAREPVVETVMRDLPVGLTTRAVQLRFLSATGMSRMTALQIERARRAAALLRSGVSILDTVDRVGYSDQPHLSRALKRYIGHSPGQLLSSSKDLQLSFLSVHI